MVNRFVMFFGGLTVILAAMLIFGQSAPAAATLEFPLTRPNNIHQQSPHTTTIEFGGAMDFVYSPNAVRLAPGDSIEWLGEFSMHPLVSEDGLWSTVSSGTQFTYTFSVPGTYRYHCQNHNVRG